MSPEISSLWAWAFSWPVSTLTMSGSAAWIRLRLSCGGETPSSAAATTREVWPSRSNHFCASSNVVRTTVAPPIDSTSPNLKMPTSLTGSAPTFVASWTSASPTVQVLLVGDVLDQRHLARALRQVALDRAARVERRIDRRDHDGGRPALRLDHLAVDDELAVRLDLAVGDGDAARVAAPAG